MDIDVLGSTLLNIFTFLSLYGKISYAVNIFCIDYLMSYNILTTLQI